MLFYDEIMYRIYINSESQWFNHNDIEFEEDDSYILIWSLFCYYLLPKNRSQNIFTNSIPNQIP